MKKYLYQFLITSIVFWVTSPLVALFVQNEEIKKTETYLSSDLIITSLVFGLIFISVYNLILKRF